MRAALQYTTLHRKRSLEIFDSQSDRIHSEIRSPIMMHVRFVLARRDVRHDRGVGNT
jgi:hypothetical protein